MAVLASPSLCKESSLEIKYTIREKRTKATKYVGALVVRILYSPNTHEGTKYQVNLNENIVPDTIKKLYIIVCIFFSAD